MSFENSGHWYTREGEAMHTVLSADRKKQVNTTLRHARKLGLFPSVTTILKLLAAPQLEKWKVDQVVKAAFKHPARNDSSLWPYSEFILKKAFEEVKDAADAGTLVHAAMELVMQGKPYDEEEGVYLPMMKEHFPMHTFINPMVEFMEQNEIVGHSFEEHLVNEDHGYAG